MIEDESPVIKSLSFVLIEQSPIHFMSPSTNIHTFDLTGTSRDSLYEIWKIINRQYYPCCYIVPDIAHKYICLLYFLYFILNKYIFNIHHNFNSPKDFVIQLSPFLKNGTQCSNAALRSAWAMHLVCWLVLARIHNFKVMIIVRFSNRIFKCLEKIK